MSELHGIEAIRFAAEKLTRIKSDPNRWEIDYVDPTTGEAWVMDYPHSEYHGGGLPRLRKRVDGAR